MTEYTIDERTAYRKQKLDAVVKAFNADKFEQAGKEDPLYMDAYWALREAYQTYLYDYRSADQLEPESYFVDPDGEYKCTQDLNAMLESSGRAVSTQSWTREDETSVTLYLSLDRTGNVDGHRGIQCFDFCV